MKVTYEHVSSPSPVVMCEKCNGYLAATYTAYIDRSGYMWTLYPLRRYVAWRDLPFEKKRVNVRNVTVLPNPNAKEPAPSSEGKRVETPFSSPKTGEQIKLL